MHTAYDIVFIYSVKWIISYKNTLYITLKYRHDVYWTSIKRAEYND